MSTPKRRALVLLAAAVITSFLGLMLVGTDGHFTPQVVDLYVICQYAQAMAEGHPFQYNAGEPASTGSTSLLWTTVLAAAHAVGVRGEGLVAFAIFAGAGLYLTSVLLAHRLARRLGGEREALLAGALVALGGPVVWGYLYGSDTALFMCLALWLLDRLVAEWSSPLPRGTIAAGTLLALARPEGLVIGALVGAGWLRAAGRSASPRARLLAALPAAAGIGVLALNRVLTGNWLGTSLADKSLFANYSVWDGIAILGEYGVDVLRGLLLGFYPSQVPIGFSRGWASLYFPPAGLLFVLLALVRAPDVARGPLRLWGLTVATVFLVFSPNVFLGVHYNRYLMWALPTLLVLAAAGLGRAAGTSTPEPGGGRPLFLAGAGLWLALGFLSTLRFAAAYGDAAASVYDRDVRTARWIASHLPRGVAMANVATSIEYLTGHRNLNLHGVTSPAFFGGRVAERDANLVEALARLPEAERPPYLITSSTLQEGSPALQRLVIGDPIYRAESLSDPLLIFRMSAAPLDRGLELRSPEARRAVAGLREVDRLNVCDVRSERDHDYSFSSRLGRLNLWGTTRSATYPGEPSEVIDAGRLIFGSETFLVATEPGLDLTVVMRTASLVSAGTLSGEGRGGFELQLPESTVAVRVDDRAADPWTFRPGPGWDETVLRIPGTLVSTRRTRLTLSGRYAAYRYWFWQ